MNWCLIHRCCWLLGKCQTNICNMSCIKYKLSDIHLSSLYAEQFYIQCTKLFVHSRFSIKWKSLLRTVNVLGSGYPFHLVYGWIRAVVRCMEVRDRFPVYRRRHLQNVSSTVRTGVASHQSYPASDWLFDEKSQVQEESGFIEAIKNELERTAFVASSRQTESILQQVKNWIISA